MKRVLAWIIAIAAIVIFIWAFITLCFEWGVFWALGYAIVLFVVIWIIDWAGDNL